MPETPEKAGPRMPRIVEAGIEQAMGNLQFSGRGSELDGAPPGTVSGPVEKPADPDWGHADDYRRVADLMEVLFPGGFKLHRGDDFAVFFLFGRIVENMFRFSQSGMTDPEAAREMCEHAERIERLVAQRLDEGARAGGSVGRLNMAYPHSRGE